MGNITHDGRKIQNEALKVKLNKVIVLGYSDVNNNALADLIAAENTKLSDILSYKLGDFYDVTQVYYDKKGVLTASITIPANITITDYIYGIALTDQAETQISAISASKLKQSKPEGVGLKYELKLPITGTPGTVIFANSNFVEATDFQEVTNTLSAADVNLGKKIEREAKDRENTDNQLKEEIATEIKARNNADNELRTQINNEIKARSGADTALGNKINREIIDRTSTDNNLQSQIDYIKENNLNHAVRQAIISGRDELIKTGNRETSHSKVSLYAGESKNIDVFTGLNMGDGFDLAADYPLDTPQNWNGGVVLGKNRFLDGTNWFLHCALFPSDLRFIPNLTNAPDENRVNGVDSNLSFRDGYIKLSYGNHTHNKSGSSYMLTSLRTTRRIKGNTGGDGVSKPYEAHYNPDTGFLAAKRKGNLTSGQTLPIPQEMIDAGCGKPIFIICKRVDKPDWWVAQFSKEAKVGDYFRLEDPCGLQNLSNVWPALPTESEIIFGDNTCVNDNDGEYLVLAFFGGKDYFEVGKQAVNSGDNTISYSNDLGKAQAFITKVDGISANWRFNDIQRGLNSNRVLAISDDKESDHGFYVKESNQGSFIFNHGTSDPSPLYYLAIKTDKSKGLILNADSENPAILTFADGYNDQGKTKDHSVSIKENIRINGELKASSFNYIYVKLIDDSLEFYVDQNKPVYFETNQIDVTQGHLPSVNSLISEGVYGKATVGDNHYTDRCDISAAFDPDLDNFYHSSNQSVSPLNEKFFQYQTKMAIKPEYIYLGVRGQSSSNALLDLKLIASKDGTFKDNNGSHYELFSINCANNERLKKIKIKTPDYLNYFKLIPVNFENLKGSQYLMICYFKLLGVPINLFNTKEYKFYHKEVPEKRIYLGEVETNKDNEIVNIFQYPKGGEWESEIYTASQMTNYTLENLFRTDKINLEIFLRENSNFQWQKADYDQTPNEYGMSTPAFDNDLISFRTGERVSPVISSEGSLKSFSSNQKKHGEFKVVSKRRF